LDLFFISLNRELLHSVFLTPEIIY
jgi:hypothetical protein